MSEPATPPGPLGGLATGPNLLSLARIPLGVLVWLAPGSVAWLVALTTLAGLTDVLDGWWARRRGITGTGAWLDPFCDKAFILSALGAVWSTRGAPGWLLAALLAREGVQSAAFLAAFALPALRRRLGATEYRASWPGKLVTGLQVATVFALLLGRPEAWPLALLCGALGAGVALHYVARGLSGSSEAPPEVGPQGRSADADRP